MHRRESTIIIPMKTTRSLRSTCIVKIWTEPHWRGIHWSRRVRSGGRTRACLKNHFRRAFFRHALEDVKGIPGIFLLVIAIVVRVSCKYGLWIVARVNKKDRNLFQTCTNGMGRFRFLSFCVYCSNDSITESMVITAPSSCDNFHYWCEKRRWCAVHYRVR